MKISALITKNDNENLKKYAAKEKLNIEIAAGRAVKAFLRAQEIKEEMDGK